MSFLIPDTLACLPWRVWACVVFPSCLHKRGWGPPEIINNPVYKCFCSKMWFYLKINTKSDALTPWPWDRVNAAPLLKSDLKNWWVKCCAKNANIRLVPCGSGMNRLLISSFSAKTLTSGSSFLPKETLKRSTISTPHRIYFVSMKQGVCVKLK